MSTEINIGHEEIQ